MRYRALDAWRGLAALFVAVFHFDEAHQAFYLGAFVTQSYLFVDFFFVLSGLVISLTYAERIRQPGEAGRFVLRRIGRLWPLHVVMLGAMIADSLFRGRTVETDLFTADGLNPILTNLALVQSLGFHDRLTFNLPSWSISTEFYVYLLFMVIALAPRRLIPALSAACVLIGVGVVLAFSKLWLCTTYDWGFFRCMYGFFLGYFVFKTLEGKREKVPGGTWLEVLAIVGVGAYLVVQGGPDVSPLSLIAPLVFVPVILVFATESGAVSWLLKARPLQHLGELSYSLYMVHVFVLAIFRQTREFLSDVTGIDLGPGRIAAGVLDYPGLRIALSLMLYLAMVIALSHVTYYLVERPGRDFFNRLASRPRLPRPATLD